MGSRSLALALKWGGGRVGACAACHHDGDGPKLLGDVVISAERAQRQAEERGHALDAEVALLITHGLLHLLGEDHDTPERKAAMWARQQAVLDALGHVVKDFGDA